VLELLDVAEESFDLVPSSVDVVIELGIHLVAPVDLRLKVLDRAIDIAKRALLRTVLALLVFEVGFQLHEYVSIKTRNERRYIILPP
jgi:hypothetical protein